ncbi:hypothetical protein [Halorubellus salinus]|uniref:hypothetical protein n=1 Tax=Halorubellus salinus TaxID=755309 RepID=UPI001D060A6B|nr:hypothetical protein [Halorubellus salinus]
MTPEPVDVHGHRLRPGTTLAHDRLGPIQITTVTMGADGDPRIEVHPINRPAREWFVFTLSGLRTTWGNTITPTTNHTDTTAIERVRNPVQTDGGRVIDDEHECTARIDQQTDTERCQLCGALLTQ